MHFNALTQQIAPTPVLDRKRPPRESPEQRATVRVTRKFAASPERVFDAWLDPRIAGAWLFATASRPMTRVSIDARVGGAFRFVDELEGEHIEHAGVYLDIVRPRRLAFTLSGNSRSREISHVNVEIAPANGGCKLVLVHENLPAKSANRTGGRWTGILYGLAETLKSLPVRAAGRRS